MRNMLLKTFSRLRQDEKGVTLVEYGIAIVLAVTVGTASLSALAGSVDQQMDDACNEMGDGANCAGAVD